MKLRLILHAATIIIKTYRTPEEIVQKAKEERPEIRLPDPEM
jgi:hypothetical protein